MDANDIQIFVCRTARISGQACLCCVKKHPFPACFILLLFLLYLFLPVVFSFLFYSFPLVGFAFLAHKVFLGIDRQNVRKIVEDNKSRKEAVKSRRSFRSVNRSHLINGNNGGSSMYGQQAIRRNAKDKGDENYTNTSVQDKDAIFSTSFNDDLVDKNALIEEKPKEIREVKVESVFDKDKRLSSNEGYQKYGNGKGETGGESLDVSEDEDEEQEPQEDRDKAVRWTEDDQKNLMDLGISEIERNKRLESLIARRRSRKLLNFQDRRMGMGNNINDHHAQIAAIHIPKVNPFLADSSGGQTSPGPGSAPPCLLPMRNPFDLPYDPHEEKPNLTGDSFHQEFAAFHQKEIMFCRHESFTSSAFLPPDCIYDKHELSFYNNFATKRMNSQSPGTSAIDKEDDDKQIQQDSPISNDDNNKNHVEEDESSKVVDVADIEHKEDGTEPPMKEIQVQQDASSDQSSSSSSSSEDEPILRPNREAILHCLSMSRLRAAAVSDIEDSSFQRRENSYESGPSATFGRIKADESFFFGGNKGIYHAPSLSIASDLQVEFSEVGSPPLTNISSQGEESSILDGDIEKAKESWVKSSNVSGVDENESRSAEVHEVNVQDILEVGSDPLELNNLPEKIVEHDTTNFKEQDGRLTENIAADPSDGDSFGNPEEPSSSPDELKSQLKLNIHHASGPELQEKTNVENLKILEDMEARQENGQNIVALEPHGENNIPNEEEVRELAEDKDAYQQSGSIEANHNLEERDQRRENKQQALDSKAWGMIQTSPSPNSQSDISIDNSRSTPEMDNKVPDEDREGKQGGLEAETQSLIYPSPSAAQSPTADVQLSALTSSSSSPKFMFQNEVLIDQSSTSNHEMVNEVPYEDRERNYVDSEVETQSLIHPSPSVEQVYMANVQDSAPTSSSSSPKFVFESQVSVNQSSSSTREIDNEIPYQVGETQQGVLEIESHNLTHPSPSVEQAYSANTQVSASVSTNSAPKFTLQNEASIYPSSASTHQVDNEVSYQDREGQSDVLGVETHSLIHPTPSVEQMDLAYTEISAPASYASSPKFMLHNDLFSATTGEINNKIPDTDRESQHGVLEVGSHSSIQMSPSFAHADLASIRVSAPASMASSPKFTLQNEVSIGESSTSTRVIHEDEQISNVEMFQSNHLDDLSGASQSSVDRSAESEHSTEVTVEQVPITMNSPNSVLQPDLSIYHISSFNSFDDAFNEVQQSNNGIREVDLSDHSLGVSLAPTSSQNGVHQADNLVERSSHGRD